MKKFLAVMMTLVMLISLCGLTSVAGSDEIATVYVSVSDDKGELVLTQAEVVVTDVDEDGAITINDALYQAHEDYFVGGAAEGFASSMGAFGIQLDKLWGIANGGSYGYYVNNTSAMGLGDVVKDGDYINAFVYTDLNTWSDTYCFFDKYVVEADQDEEVELTLSAAGYDADWNPVTLPVEGATILLNGEATEYKTDAEGKVTIKIAESGDYVISAVSDAQILVPPVCLATINNSGQVNAYVTIADDKGELVLTQKEVVVSDVDEDGSITINDALYIAHEENYEGGAAAGYASAYTDYGLSLNKLWGVENGGSYGYYVNNASAWSLADAITDGSYINAFVYTDLATWSDTYCYFDQMAMDIDETEEIKLQLLYAGYDEAWNPVSLPVVGAVITIDGEESEYITDEEGYVSFNLEDGEYVISASSETMVLVPPACVISVEDVDDADTDNNDFTDNDANEDGDDNTSEDADDSESDDKDDSTEDEDANVSDDKNESANENEAAGTKDDTTPTTGNNNSSNTNVNNTGNSDKATGTTTAPKTVDASLILVYVAIMFAAVSALIVLKNKKVYEK